MTRTLKTLVAAAAISVGVAASSQTAQAQFCTACEVPQYQCTLVAGPGYLKCTNIPEGCRLEGDCSVTKHPPRESFSPEGTLFLPTRTVALDVGPRAHGPFSTAEESDSESAEGARPTEYLPVNGGFLPPSIRRNLRGEFDRTCNGFITRRTYTSVTGETMRREISVLIL